MDLDLKGTRVVVTAGASGIGRAIASGFLREGARVAVCDNDEGSVAKLRTAVPEAAVELCDVTDRAAVSTFIAGAVAHMGGLDVLVNNAGIAGPTARIEDVEPQDWDRCLDVCLTGQFNCARVSVPHLRESKNASIVNMSSAAGRLGFALRTPYAAAKWGVIGLTKSLAIELGKDRVRVNAILPGIVAGDRQRRVMEAKARTKGVSFAEIEAEVFSYTSIRDYVTAEQIADQILFLSSHHGRSISGQAISICGDTKMLA